MTEPVEHAEAAPVEAPRPRGWVSLYLVSFGLLLAAGVVLGVSARGFLESIGLLWLSIVLSGAAAVSAVVSVVLPARRRSG